MPPRAHLREQHPFQDDTRCWFRNAGWWRFLCLVVHEDQVFCVIWGWGWYFRDAEVCIAPPFRT